MRLFPKVDNLIDHHDRAAILTPPFDLNLLSQSDREPTGILSYDGDGASQDVPSGTATASTIGGIMRQT